MLFDAKVKSITANAGGSYDRAGVLHDLVIEGRVPPMSRTARATITFSGLTADEVAGYTAGGGVRVSTTPTE